jgi:hypothetical protein
MNTQDISVAWNTHGGYAAKPDTTLLLTAVTGYENSYNELIDNKSIFTLHSSNPKYIQTGPLRECISAHLISENQSSIKADTDKFVETMLLLDRLKKIIDITNSKILKKAYVTCLAPGKQIYEHSDTDGPYWNTINRYQFYYTGNDKIIQLINNTLYPIKPGYFYHFDHQQLHSYHNNSLEDLLLIVFDVSKN